MVVIVRAKSKDADAVLDLVGRLLAELSDESSSFPGLDRTRLRDHLSRDMDGFTAFLATDAGSPIGVVTVAEAVAVYADGRYGIISELYIEPEYRSQGVGAQLLRAVQSEARSRGWSRIEVTAPPGSRWDRSVAFYKQNGFVFAGPKLKLLL